MHRRAIRLIACLALPALACGPSLGAFCDAQGNCPGARLCEPATKLCVVDEPPVVTIHTPTSGARFDGTVLHLEGHVQDDVSVVSADVRIGGEAGTWLPLSIQGDGTVVTDVPVLPMDQAPLQVDVRAFDNRMQVGISSVYPLVDNLTPSARFEPPDGTRKVSGRITLVFSEPVEVTDGGVPLVLTTAADGGTQSPGSWDTAHRTFTISGLSPDTGYTATYAANLVHDDFGHLNPLGGSARIWTEPKQPDNLILMTLEDAMVSFDSASDPDGVVTLVVKARPATGPEKYILGRVDPKTGAFTPFNKQEETLGPTAIYQAVAGATFLADMTPVRASGFSENPLTAASIALPFIDGLSVTLSTNVSALLAVPAPCGPSTPPLATLSYAAGGPFSLQWPGVQIPVSNTATRTFVRSSLDWELLDERPSGDTFTVDRQHFLGTCPLPASPLSHTPNFLTGVSNLSVALPLKGANFYVYNLNNTRVLDCVVCAADDSQCAHDTSQVSSVAGNLQIAAGPPRVLLGARRNDRGQVELLQRDATLCSATWKLLAPVPDSTAGTVFNFQPVLLGNQPALLLQRSNTLSIYFP